MLSTLFVLLTPQSSFLPSSRPLQSIGHSFNTFCLAFARKFCENKFLFFFPVAFALVLLQFLLLSKFFVSQNSQVLCRDTAGSIIDCCKMKCCSFAIAFEIEQPLCRQLWFEIDIACNCLPPVPSLLLEGSEKILAINTQQINNDSQSHASSRMYSKHAHQVRNLPHNCAGARAGAASISLPQSAAPRCCSPHPR